MLLGLWHPSVVSSDHKKREIDGTDAGDHVADEILVARNIHDCDVNTFVVRTAQIQFGETEIDRDLARFLFRQPIRVGSGQGFYQRALAMIDMAGRRNNEMFGSDTMTA